MNNQNKISKAIKVPKTGLGKILNYIKYLKVSRLLLSTMHNGYLVEIGWFDSLRQQRCIDENGDEIPWSCYPYINFLKDYLKKDMDVFEYGGGYSTLFLAKRSKSVTTVEHNTEWVKKLDLESLENGSLLMRELDEKYETAILDTPNTYDLIIVDGRRRVACLKEAVKKVKPDGIVVLDDSDRAKYQEGIDFMLSQGFKQLNFWGISPLAFINRKATVFFKELNL